jgi:hypothetical protein
MFGTFWALFCGWFGDERLFDKMQIVCHVCLDREGGGDVDRLFSLL